MGMLQLGSELNFPTEAFAVDAGGEVRGKDLDDDGTAEAPILGDEHPAHSAAQQLALELVARAQRLLEIVSEIRHDSIEIRHAARRRRGGACRFIRYGQPPPFALMLLGPEWFTTA